MKNDVRLFDRVMDSLVAAKSSYDALPPLKQGMKPIYHRVLYMIHRLQEEHGAARVSDLSSGLDILLPNMTKLLKEMEGQQLVEKYRPPTDKRVVQIRMTSQGEQYFNDRVLPYRNQVLKELDNLEPADVETMIRTIHQIQDILHRVYADRKD
jgi:DNA-binding MarR family transcriptional regulator